MPTPTKARSHLASRFFYRPAHGGRLRGTRRIARCAPRHAACLSCTCFVTCAASSAHPRGQRPRPQPTARRPHRTPCTTPRRAAPPASSCAERARARRWRSAARTPAATAAAAANATAPGRAAGRRANTRVQGASTPAHANENARASPPAHNTMREGPGVRCISNVL